MFSRKTLFFVTAISLLAFSAKADTPACVSVDCAALGYTKTVAQCSGADTILKCPFDANKVACPLIVETPILTIAQDLLDHVCHVEPIYTLGTDISSCNIAYMSANDFCSNIYTHSGLKITPARCQAYLADNPSAYSSMKTTQDLVSIMENILLYVPCANSVSLGEFEVCTNYCAYDNTKCMEKRAMTCQEAVNKEGGILLSSAPSNNAIFGEKKKIYLTESVTISKPIDTLRSSFYEAASFAPCQDDFGSADLTITGPIYSIESPEFHTVTEIESINLTERFSRLTTSQPLFIKNISFSANNPLLTIDAARGEKITVQIQLYCSTGLCRTDIIDNFQYQNKYIWCGSSSDNEVSVDGVACVSTNSSDYCYHQLYCQF